MDSQKAKTQRLTPNKSHPFYFDHSIPNRLFVKVLNKPLQELVNILDNAMRDSSDFRPNPYETTS